MRITLDSTRKIPAIAIFLAKTESAVLLVFALQHGADTISYISGQISNNVHAAHSLQ